ncbi:MAG: T9SS type A sorting domain-containing protein [Flavobacteriaceae bacterium]|nr:T9SS type A sorting domain-containing protein [Flavobacteriaceae bacterium]
MRVFYLFLLITNLINAQTIWTGPKVTFTKANNSNGNLEANQDGITDIVRLARSNENVLYNAIIQTAAPTDGYNSPLDTEWAEGTTADINTLTFTDFKSAAPTASSGAVRVKDMVGRNYVLHLITDDIYIDLKMLAWGTRSQGAGFSYERSTEANLGISVSEKNPAINIFPNPVSSIIHVKGLTKSQPYRIYTILGTEIQSGVVANNQEIDVKSLKSGMYLLQLKRAYPFLKK